MRKFERMNRRDFIKCSAEGLMFASLPFALQNCVKRGNTTIMDLKLPEKNYFFNEFGITKQNLTDILNLGMESGGDYADIFFEYKLENNLVFEDDIIKEGFSNVTLGAGIRVIKGDQTGYSYTENLTLESLKNASKTAAKIADSGKSNISGTLSEQTPANNYPLKIFWKDITTNKKIEIIRKLNETIHKKDNAIVKVNILFADEEKNILIATSDGKIVADYQPLFALRASCIIQKKNQKESGSYSYSERNDFNSIDTSVIEKIADISVNSAQKMFEAIKPHAGEMEVVLSTGGAGILLHEAIGHCIEADFNRKNLSIMSDKIGKKVAEPFVTVVDDATNEHYRGSINIDDEGNSTERTTMVENGILRSYLHDNISSKYYKTKPTGNGRRQSFRFPPLPRMRNTYMLPGPHKKEEIIASVKRGMLAELFTNGQVNIGAGDFTFYVKLGYLIENGKITTPVKDINLIGNGPLVLSKIVMVADDLDISKMGWMCGKSGQMVPVSQGIPTVKVSSITVGGIN